MLCRNTVLGTKVCQALFGFFCILAKKENKICNSLLKSWIVGYLFFRSKIVYLCFISGKLLLSCANLFLKAFIFKISFYIHSPFPSPLHLACSLLEIVKILCIFKGIDLYSKSLKILDPCTQVWKANAANQICFFVWLFVCFLSLSLGLNEQRQQFHQCFTPLFWVHCELALFWCCLWFASESAHFTFFQSSFSVKSKWCIRILCQILKSSCFVAICIRMFSFHFLSPPQTFKRRVCQTLTSLPSRLRACFVVMLVSCSVRSCCSAPWQQLHF